MMSYAPTKEMEFEASFPLNRAKAGTALMSRIKKEEPATSPPCGAMPGATDAITSSIGRVVTAAAPEGTGAKAATVTELPGAGGREDAGLELRATISARNVGGRAPIVAGTADESAISEIEVLREAGRMVMRHLRAARRALWVEKEARSGRTPKMMNSH
jgi:hypothetical protein